MAFPTFTLIVVVPPVAPFFPDFVMALRATAAAVLYTYIVRHRQRSIARLCHLFRPILPSSAESFVDDSLTICNETIIHNHSPSPYYYAFSMFYKPITKWLLHFSYVRGDYSNLGKGLSSSTNFASPRRHHHVFARKKKLFYSPSRIDLDGTTTVERFHHMG